MLYVIILCIMVERVSRGVFSGAIIMTVNNVDVDKPGNKRFKTGYNLFTEYMTKLSVSCFLLVVH